MVHVSSVTWQMSQEEGGVVTYEMACHFPYHKSSHDTPPSYWFIPCVSACKCAFLVHDINLSLHFSHGCLNYVHNLIILVKLAINIEELVYRYY